MVKVFSIVVEYNMGRCDRDTVTHVIECENQILYCDYPLVLALRRQAHLALILER